MPPESWKSQLVSSLLLGGLLLTAVALQAEGARGDSNEIELRIDGKLSRNWTVTELMKGRFDWESPKGQIYPAVPLSYLLGSGDEAIDRKEIRMLRVVGRNQKFEIDAAHLPPLEDLLLRLDVARGGSWQLTARTEAARAMLEALGQERRIRRVWRLEITTRAEP